MKFRTTLILLAVFAVLLGAVLLFESRDRAAATAKEKAAKLVDLAAADVERIAVKTEAGTLAFAKDEKGEWRVTEPLEAQADTAEVGRLAESFAALTFDRVVEAEGGDPKAYEIPKKEVSLWVKGQAEPVIVLIGMENPLDKSLFAQKAGDPRIVLLPSHLSATLDKGLVDFRRKDVFGFDRAEVKSVKVAAPNGTWEAALEGEAWRLTAPVKGRAAKARVDGLLDGLSGLRAKEFVAEDKTADELKAHGLAKPEYEVTLDLPAAGSKVVFALHKDGENLYATTSQSQKIVSAETTVLAELDRKVEELREKKVVDFYSWNAARVRVRGEGLDFAVVKEKADDQDVWLFETEGKEKADRSKIESFVRKIEGLEAADFVDDPKAAAAAGLDEPRLEIHVRTKDYDGKEQESAVLVGREDANRKQVFVKALGRDEVFRVDAAFLQDLPKEAKDWREAPPEGEEKKDSSPETEK